MDELAVIKAALVVTRVTVAPTGERTVTSGEHEPHCTGVLS